jgi:PTS system mannose-specific IIA component
LQKDAFPAAQGAFMDAFLAVCIGPDDDMEQRRGDIRQSIADADRGEGVLILTDMFGGTPSNLAISLIETDKVEVIAGVNLPMLIKLAEARSRADLNSLARMGQGAGKRYIAIASDVLEGANK